MYCKLPKVLNDLDSFLVPAVCFGCNAHLYRGERILCAFCRNELPLTDTHLGANSPADRLFYGQRAVVKAAAMLYFEPGGTVQRLIHHLKYRGQESIGDWLGDWYGSVLKSEKALEGIDWVLPVPLHARKMRRRGYNQCDRFGRRIAAHLHAKYSGKMLLRRRHRRTQTSKDRWLRQESIRGAFYVPRPGQLEGARILLVDDVITTGATLQACCEALGAIPGIRISIAAMALVPSHQFPN